MSTAEENAVTLAASLIATVRSMDELFDVSSVAKTLTITCLGTGKFELDIVTHEDVDISQVVNNITERIKA